MMNVGELTENDGSYGDCCIVDVVVASLRITYRLTL